MYIYQSWSSEAVSKTVMLIAAALDQPSSNGWSIGITLTNNCSVYLTKEEAYKLASSLELALLELNDDETPIPYVLDEVK